MATTEGVDLKQSLSIPHDASTNADTGRSVVGFAAASLQPTPMTLLSEPIVAVAHAPKVEELVGTWIVAGCEPAVEPRVLRDLFDVPHYRPIEQYRRKEKNAKGVFFRTLWRPLFAGYISFCCPDSEAQYRVSGHERVHSILTTALQARFVKQLSAIEYALSFNSELTTVTIQKGTRCRVTGGAFMGVEGVLVEEIGSWRFGIEVELLGRMLVLDVAREDLEPL